jgi:hypothetical protein
MKSPTAARPAPAELDTAPPVTTAGVEAVGPTGVAVAVAVVFVPTGVDTVPLVGYAAEVGPWLGVSLAGGVVMVVRVVSGQ